MSKQLQKQRRRRIVLMLVCCLLGAIGGNAAAPAADGGLKTKNVIYVTLDGMRWQEVFGGAQQLFLSKDAGVANVPRTAGRYWHESEQKRRETLMPFLWTTIARQGQIFGDPT